MPASSLPKRGDGAGMLHVSAQRFTVTDGRHIEAPAQVATGTTAWAREVLLHLSLVLVAHSPLVNLLQSCCTLSIAGKGITTATMIFRLVSRSYAEKRVLIRKCLALSQSTAFVKKARHKPKHAMPSPMNLPCQAAADPKLLIQRHPAVVKNKPRLVWRGSSSQQHTYQR